MFAEEYFREVQQICKAIDLKKIEQLASELSNLRSEGGRLFFLGVGGSAGNCGHAVNDFRKLCEIESYAPTDNVSELTARTNDNGWDTIFSDWLKASKFSQKDAIMVFSVGGGNLEKNVSPNLVKAADFVKKMKGKIFGIIGKNDGYVNKIGDQVLVVPNASDQRITPHSEAFQAVVWHCLVSHPQLQLSNTKW
jgi:D-sedoheptulose 7-phosphate isomerase